MPAGLRLNGSTCNPLIECKVPQVCSLLDHLNYIEEWNPPKRFVAAKNGTISWSPGSSDDPSNRKLLLNVWNIHWKQGNRWRWYSFPGIARRDRLFLFCSTQPYCRDFFSVNDSLTQKVKSET